MAKHEWFRWLMVGVLATAAGAIASAFMEAWAAGGIGVAIGLGAAFALARWDERHRHVPDFEAIFEEGLK